MPAASKNGAKGAFDAALFTKLIALCGSPIPQEADAAFHRALEFSAKCQLSFQDAITAAYGSSRAAQLESDLKILRSATDEALRDAVSAINDLRSERISLTDEITKWRSGEKQVDNPEPCRSCESKRRVIALIAGVALEIVYLRYPPWGLSREWQRELGMDLVVLPWCAVVARWQWLMFKRRHAWKTWTDNDVWRLLKGKWNKRLERMQL